MSDKTELTQKETTEVQPATEQTVQEQIIRPLVDIFEDESASPCMPTCPESPRSG